jgi:pantoate kinase
VCTLTNSKGAGSTSDQIVTLELHTQESIVKTQIPTAKSRVQNEVRNKKKLNKVGLIQVINAPSGVGENY